ncbi:MAG: hypothetical protein ABI137_05075 [Antricoccus sp.]
MSAVDVILVFAGIPLLVIAFVWSWILLTTSSGSARYHLGQPWDSQPLWFVGHPKGGVSTHPALIESDRTARLQADESAGSGPAVHGGASGSW